MIVARRAGLVTGRVAAQRLRRETSFQVDDMAFCWAEVLRQDPSRPEENRCEIGAFDLAQQTWRFYPEFVQPEEVLGLRRTFTRLADDGLAAYELRDSFLDVRHELTAHAHRETAALLASAGVTKRLIADATLDHVIAIMDEASAAAIVRVPSRYLQRGETTGQTLYVQYNSVLNNVDRRQSRIHVEIASMAPGLNRPWIPNERAISAGEWEVLRGGIEILRECEAASPDFEADMAAVVYRRERQQAEWVSSI